MGKRKTLSGPVAAHPKPSTQAELDLLLRDIYFALVRAYVKPPYCQPPSFADWLAKDFLHNDPATNPLTQKMVDMFWRDWEAMAAVFAQEYPEGEYTPAVHIAGRFDKFKFYGQQFHPVNASVFLEEGEEEAFWDSYKNPNPPRLPDSILQEIALTEKQAETT